MNNVTQIQVFVSNPSDVTPEKKIVEQVCQRLNKTFLQSQCSIQFIVREWGEVFGQIGIHPQDSINATIKDYDIYVGILWMRFGTPTKNINPNTGLPYQSGTEEEFEIAYDRWKTDEKSVRINCFFKNPVAVNTIEGTDQLKRVLEFKDRVQQIGMTNSFVNEHDFKDQINDLLLQIGLRLCLEKKTEIKNEIFTSTSSTSQKSLKSKLLEVLNKSLSHFEKLDYYIPRSIRPARQTSESIGQIFASTEYKTLTEVAIASNRIVLLGNAGTGKSIELQQLALSISEPSNPFIPFYTRFNTYVDDDIEKLLPPEWKEINQEVLLLLFDGLDEIQSKHYNTAIRKISNFSQRFPNLKIIISCRTNFYEIPSESLPGTLPDFECYYLNDLSLEEIKKYATQNFKIDGQQFIESAFSADYLDLITKPFFLNILIGHFKKFGNLNSKRAEIIKEPILSRINFDKVHFNTTVDKVPTKEEIIKQLQKVALAMEMIGRNFITTVELKKIVDTEWKFDSLKYFSAFNKSSSVEDAWSFEHNNIQEYLAASVLAEEPIEKIQHIVSFPPNYNKIKPSWVNTLSFLVSIANAKDVEGLVNWLIETEPEIIVKFEKDRVAENVRIDLFKQIFLYYKQKGIWLNSNKFTDAELARFSESEEVINYLCKEITDDATSRVVKLNAIHILDRIDFSLFPIIYLEKVKLILLDLLEKNQKDSGFVYSILRAMAELGLNNREIIAKVLKMYGQRRNQYIRAGLYKLIGESNFVNEYIEVFLDGIRVSDDDSTKDDREDVNLADESWLLKEGLAKVNSPDAIKKVLQIFTDNTGRKYTRVYEKKEILKKIKHTAIELHQEGKSVYDDVFELFISFGKLYDLEDAKSLIPFFEKTKTKQKTFKRIWDNTNIPEYEKGSLLVLLTDLQTIDDFVNEYFNRNLTTEDVFNFHKELVWHVRNSEKTFNAIEYLEEQVKSKTGLIIEKPQQIDFEEINKRKAQENFDILFDKDAFLAETKRVFDEIGEEEINYEALWQVRRKNNQILDDYFLSTVLEALRDFTRNNTAINFNTIFSWINSSDFEFYQISEIHELLKNNNKIQISPPQRQVIEQWSLKTAKSLNWQQLITSRGAKDESISVSRFAEYLWFFVDTMELKLDEEYLLAFTRFTDFNNNLQESQFYVINRLEELLDAKTVQSKVKENLENGIDVSWVWKSNALYAIDRNLNDVFPIIIENIKDESKSEYQRHDVLNAYFNKTLNTNALREILVNTQSEIIENAVIDLLIPFSNETIFLTAFLKKRIERSDSSNSAKFRSARGLIQLNDVAGLAFYTNYLINDPSPSFDFHQLSFLAKLTIIEAIPDLLKLLKIAKEPPLNDDKFNFLESSVLSAFHSIGTYSEKNLMTVKTALTSFIEQNQSAIPNINFLHISIARMEEQFYMDKSKSYAIDEVVMQMQEIGL